MEPLFLGRLNSLLGGMGFLNVTLTAAQLQPGTEHKNP